jgi:hypothetical protein
MIMMRLAIGMIRRRRRREERQMIQSWKKGNDNLPLPLFIIILFQLAIKVTSHPDSHLTLTPRYLKPKG